MQGGLSTRKANPINPILKRVKATQNVFQWDGRITLRMENEGVVMAVRTAEVTIGEEKYRAELFWPIHKGGF
jgi:hypothetical protein